MIAQPNVTFCGQSRPGFARGPAIGPGSLPAAAVRPTECRRLLQPDRLTSVRYEPVRQ